MLCLLLQAIVNHSLFFFVALIQVAHLAVRVSVSLVGDLSRGLYMINMCILQYGAQLWDFFLSPFNLTVKAHKKSTMAH